MFHRDELHTGVAEGVGNVNPQTGPRIRWTYQVTAPPPETDFAKYRWYSSFPLGDLDGDGTLEVVVTSADNFVLPHRVIALKDTPGQNPPVRELWSFSSPSTDVRFGVDQYSAALADADGDGLLDVLFSSKDGFVRALKGTTGEVIWEYDTDHFIEAGPMIGDLDGDGALEVIVPTDCAPGPECVGQIANGALYVFAANPRGGNPVLWSLEFPFKLDSAEPALVDLDPNDGRNLKAIVFGAWDGKLHVLWSNPDGSIVQNEFDLRQLENLGGHGGGDGSFPNAVVRSTPLLYDFGQGWTAVLGWMPDWNVGWEARIGAVRINADMRAGTVEFTPLWNISRDDWKSSVALLPLPGRNLVVTGYGIGNQENTGNYGRCDWVLGGIIAIDPLTGQVVWENDYGDREGNVRGSPAVADIDGDGAMEVLLTMGCYGKIYAYDGATGAQEWGFQLGPRTIGTPSVGDLDGDGTLEIVVPSYDGKVYALGVGEQPRRPRRRLIPSASTGAATVQVNGAQRYQTFEGFGASLTIFEETGVYNRHDPSQPVVTTATRQQREAIADLLYRQLGLSRLRIFLEDFEPVNDNADPFTFNPSAFDWSVVDAELGFAVLAQPYGLRTPWLTFAMEAGEKQAWLRTSPQACSLNPAMIDEEVEWLLAGALRARQQGMDLQYMTINNEPDLCPPSSFKIEVADYVTIVKRLGARLRAEGLQTMIVVSDGWLPTNAIEYMRAALADPEARAYIGALATHSYDDYSYAAAMMEASAGGRPPSHAAVTVREQIRELSRQYNLPVWMTEVCYCVPQQGLSEFDLVWTRLNHLYDELTITNVAAFDGMNSFFIYRPGVQDEFVNVYFRPDGALDRFELSLYGSLIGHYSRFIVPGSVRLGVSSSDPRVRVVAFQRPDGRVTLVALNDNPYPVTVEVSLTGLNPLPAALSVVTSREGALWQENPDLPLAGGKTQLVLPALSVTSLLEKR